MNALHTSAASEDPIRGTPRTGAPSSPRRLNGQASSLVFTALLVAGGAAALSLVIAALTEDGWGRLVRSYLMAYMFLVSLCLGALFFTMLHHATRAGWSVVLRRMAEAVASSFLWLWVLFVPILVAAISGWGDLYHWRHPGGDEILQHKAPYFFFINPMTLDEHGQWTQRVHVPWFWILRAALFLGVWAYLGRFFFRNSVDQDATGDLIYTRRMERFAPPAFILFALSLAFASIDWAMSLEPHWFSTMFPVYFFAASCCGFFSLQILMMYFMQRSGHLTQEITAEHYQDAGKLLFAFGIVFWAYIAFSQYMLIWYANIPEETPWYLARQLGGWLGVSLLLLLGHFFGPFLILLSRHPKRRAATLAVAAGWMLLMHAVDIYWLVMPRVPAEKFHAAANYTDLKLTVTNQDLGYGWHVLDATWLAAMSALLVAGTLWRLTGCSLIPQRDPRLPESLAFENI